MQVVAKKRRGAWVVAAAMAGTPHPAEEQVEATRTRFRAVAEATAVAAEMSSTPRWVAALEAAMRCSFRAAWVATAVVVTAMRLQEYREAATAAGMSKPYRAVWAVMAVGWVVARLPSAVQFPCRCSR